MRWRAYDFAYDPSDISLNHTACTLYSKVEKILIFKSKMAQSEQALYLAQALTIASRNSQIATLQERLHALTPRFYLNDDGVICHSNGCHDSDQCLYDFREEVLQQHEEISFVSDYGHDPDAIFKTYELVGRDPNNPNPLLFVFVPDSGEYIYINIGAFSVDYADEAIVKKLIGDLFDIFRQEPETCPRFHQSLDDFQQALNAYHACE